MRLIYCNTGRITVIGEAYQNIAKIYYYPKKLKFFDCLKNETAKVDLISMNNDPRNKEWYHVCIWSKRIDTKQICLLNHPPSLPLKACRGPYYINFKFCLEWNVRYKLNNFYKFIRLVHLRYVSLRKRLALFRSYFLRHRDYRLG